MCIPFYICMRIIALLFPKNYLLTHFSPMAHIALLVRWTPMPFHTNCCKVVLPNSVLNNVTLTHFISYDANFPEKFWTLMWNTHNQFCQYNYEFKCQMIHFIPQHQQHYIILVEGRISNDQSLSFHKPFSKILDTLCTTELVCQ